MKHVCVCQCGIKGASRQKDTEITWAGGFAPAMAAEGDAVGRGASGVSSCSVGMALASFPEELRSKGRDPAWRGTSRPVTRPDSKMAFTCGIKVRLWQRS